MTVSGLKINEIFYSLQGESTLTGLPTVFVRLSGCPLRCKYCDTSYAFYSGDRLSVEDIIAKIKSYNVKRVCVTGGEPLAQQNVLQLISVLCDEHYKVSIETSGAMDVSAVDKRAMLVLDIKTPSSGEVTKNLWSNLALLKSGDQVKIVICCQNDFDWAKDIINNNPLNDGCEWIFSPMTPGLEPKLLAEWILNQKKPLPVRMQIQLHKLLWDDAQGK